jgi:hypothetical protein
VDAIKSDYGQGIIMKFGIFSFGAVCVSVLVTTGCMGPFDNPSDSHSSTFTVKSEACISVVSNSPIFQFDTISFTGGITSEPVNKAGLVRKYDWDFGNDGKIDTTLTTPATLRIPVRRSGTYSVALQLTDSLGYTSKAVSEIVVIPRFKAEVILPDIDINSTCAFYTQNEHTMKPVVLLGRYLTYRNKSESMTLGNFVFELLKNLTGTLDFNSLFLPYKTDFNNGVYTLKNDSLTMKAAFLYGSDLDNNKENDTIRYDLFDPKSYMTFKVQLYPPDFTYVPGPLWNLTSGFNVDISDLSKPKISLNIAMNDLKFSGIREVSSRYTLNTVLRDSNQLSEPLFDAIMFGYHGLARIDPMHVGEIVSRVQNDSLEIDMSGSEISTDSFPMTFTLNDRSDTSKVTFNFLLKQKMLQQQVRFGNSGGNRKVIGSYAAQSQLSVNEMSFVNSYFKGAYSTTSADTASFYCEQDMSTKFGALYFDKPQQGFLTFISERYSYQFSMQEDLVVPVK